jgi:hypothetical protein
MRAILRKLPLPIKHRIKRFIYRIAPQSNPTLSKEPDVYVISYPKCGRTWLRMMMGKTFASYLGIEDSTSLQMEDTIAYPSIPTIKFTHDDQPNLKKPNQLSANKTNYKKGKVIFLCRDIRDAIVSYYFELIKRNTVNPHYPHYEGNLSSFLHHDQGSVDTMIRYYNIWAENRHIPKGFLLVRYEDMHSQPEQELRRILDFIGLTHISDQIIQEAIIYASFNNMRKMEETAALDSFRLRPGDKNDPESFKTRRGKVNGFIDYLNPEDITYLNHKINSELTEYYGYHRAIE